MELLIVFIAVLFLGIALIRKFISSNKDDSFFLGSRDAGAVSLTASMTATWVGAASIIALSGWVAEFGPAASWYLFFPGIGLILLGLFGVPTIRRRPGNTMADYYDNTFFRYSFLVFLVIFYTLVLGAQFVGFAKLSSILGFSYGIGLGIAAGIVSLYVILGGFNSVRDTDIAQFILVAAGIVVLLNNAQTDIVMPSISSLFKPHEQLSDNMFYTFVSLGFVMFVAQENHQRIKAAKSTASAQYACVFSGMIIICFGLVIGSFASSYSTDGENPVITAIGTLDTIPLAFVTIAIMGAALSTADSALNIAAYSLSESLARFNISSVKTLSVIIPVLIGVSVANIFSSVGLIIVICINLFIGLILPVVLGVLWGAGGRTIVLTLLTSVTAVAIGYMLSSSMLGIIGLVSGCTVLILLHAISAIRT